jgi:hypothetical protein
MGLDCFAVIAVTLQCQQQIEGLAPDFEHAGQHGPFHEIETSAVLGGCFHIRLELIDKRVELLGDLFGVALLSKFDDFHGGGLLAFVNRIGNTRIMAGRPLLVYTDPLNRPKQPVESRLHPHQTQLDLKAARPPRGGNGKDQ